MMGEYPRLHCPVCANGPWVDCAGSALSLKLGLLKLHFLYVKESRIIRYYRDIATGKVLA